MCPMCDGMMGPWGWVVMAAGALLLLTLLVLAGWLVYRLVKRHGSADRPREE